MRRPLALALLVLARCAGGFHAPPRGLRPTTLRLAASTSPEPREFHVSNIAFDASEDELRACFEAAFGRVESVRLATDPATGAHRGHARVVFPRAPALAAPAAKYAYKFFCDEERERVRAELGDAARSKAVSAARLSLIHI